MIGPGRSYYALVTGREGARSFLGLSIYGDLYWQFGWWGILLVCPLIGGFFAMITIRSLQAISTREFILFPTVLIGIQISMLGPTKYMINGIIGPIPIYIAYLFLVHLIVRFLGARKERKKPVPASL
jgi:hypothetical protein